MDIGIGFGNSDGIKENDQQKALLVWATARVDQVAKEKGPREHLGDLLDWVAYVTREHFGFQQRLLNECTQYRAYLLSRVAVHTEFRRKLAGLCVDIVRRDSTVAQRLSSLCHDLLQDAQANEKVFSKIVLEGGSAGPKLRRKPRRGQVAVEAAHLVQPHTPASASEPATAIHG